MTVSKLSLKTRRSYETPKVEVIEIEPQGILCASGDAAGYGGGTETMNLTDVNWP